MPNLLCCGWSLVKRLYHHFMNDENVERQNNETLLLQAVYPAEFSWRRHRADEPLSFHISVEKKISLHLALPASYPSNGQPIVGVSAQHVSESQLQSLQTALSTILDGLVSSTEERLLQIIESFREHIHTILTQPAIDAVDPNATATTEPISITPTVVVLIWFHHLLSTTKRKAIKSLESLCGISKPGYPGILVLQGPKPALDEAITELKSMRWQAMQVRGEIECEKELESGIHEVEKVAEVVTKMEEIGLGDWCLSALKMK